MAPASNEWINGYLNAFLEIDGGDQHNRSSKSKQVSRYFVEEVVNKFEERDIHRSWAKATVTRSDRVVSTRLENLCWRIWQERRKRIQAKSEQAESRVQREKRHQDATDELFEDLSEGEKLEVAEASRRMSRNVSQLQAWSEQERSRHMYIVLISLHGLVRGENMELGKDSDTGGQVKYVVELAKSLATMPGVYRVDLLTRQICSPDVDWSYGEPTEMLVPGCTNLGDSSGAYIVRLPCGPRDQYLRKELLWPYIEEFVDGALAHIHNMAKVLAEQISEHAGRSKELVWPQVIHGHYADAGYAAALLSGALNVPMIMTGHSLGRNKLEQLLAHGSHSREDANAVYKIFRRIEAEEFCLDASEIVITSTKQESVEQWGAYYSGYDVRVDRVLKIRARKGLDCHGRYMPRMAVIPPGMDFSNVILDPETAVIANEIGIGNMTTTQVDPLIWGEIMRFLHNPHKPMILALARPDPKKNITTLIKAYGECKPLRDLANLTLIMGNRDNIDDMVTANANVLTTVLKLIDKYDLHGQVSYPKHHKQYEVPAIYQLAAKTKGVFINPALVEPFGLTLIEAAAHGLPMVATSNGGPVDIQQALQNGLLVDPHDDKAIAEALLKLLADRNLWLECQKNGLKNINVYSWPEHCRTYLSRIVACRSRHPQWNTDGLGDSYSDPSSQSDSLRDLQDISIRLSVDGEKLQSIGSEKTSRNVNISVDDIKKYFEKFAHTKRKSAGNEEQLIDHDASKFMRGAVLRRRKYLFIYALDNRESYDLLKEVLKAGHRYDGRNNTGVVISTSLTISEILEDLKAAQISHTEFDAFLCSSGSEIYYPSSNEEGGRNNEQQVSKDLDYEKHISFRWDVEGMAKTLARLFNQLQNGRAESIVKEARRCSSRCLSYHISDHPLQEMKVEELHEKLRLRGLRCRIVSCQTGTRIHVVPLFASRWLALRYLFMRWGVEIPNMFVFLAESGDSDSQMLLHGMHKSIVFKSKIGEEAPPQPPGTHAESSLFVVATTCDEVLAAVKSFTRTK